MQGTTHMWSVRQPRLRAIVFALFGGVTGAVATACTFIRIGEVVTPTIGEYCLGVPTMPMTLSSQCVALDGAIYLFPGLVFGVVFGPLLYTCRCLSRIGAVVFGATAALANAVAVFVCLGASHPIDDLLPFENVLVAVAISGAIAGAIGGGSLAAVFRIFAAEAGLGLPIAVGAGLGVLAPVMVMSDEYVGSLAFYIIWQSGYAVALAFALPSRTLAHGEVG